MDHSPVEELVNLAPSLSLMFRPCREILTAVIAPSPAMCCGGAAIRCLEQGWTGVKMSSAIWLRTAERRPRMVQKLAKMVGNGQ